MGIYIKGMAMPTSCLECVFYRRTDPVYDYCCISSAIPKGYVPDDCPLVPVPSHGRLIDQDAILREVIHGDYPNQWIDKTELLRLFRNAPTIVTAEPPKEE